MRQQGIFPHVGYFSGDFRAVPASCVLPQFHISQCEPKYKHPPAPTARKSKSHPRSCSPPKAYKQPQYSAQNCYTLYIASF